MPRRQMTMWIAAAVVTLGTMTPAAADIVPGSGENGGTSTGSGFAVSVSFTGDAAPSGGGVRVVQVAAKCWWRHAEPPYDDPIAFLAHYDGVMASTAPPYVKGAYGPRARYVAAAASTTPMQWWNAYCKNVDDYASYTGETFQYNGQTLAVTYRAFPVVAGGVNPPPPLIEPEALAEVARDVMVLPLPDVERNPKTTGAGLAGATFVNLPTWFWVTDPAAVGGATGRRTIRAEVAGGAVWAEVVATTQGLVITSPAGATSCPPTTATRAWSPGTDDTSGCTVAFERASVGYATGYPVTAATTWDATWTGAGGTGGTLPALARQTVTQVPVAESQAIVTTTN